MNRSIAVILVLACALLGCSPSMIRKELVGLSIDDVQKANNKYAKTFDMKAAACMDKTLIILKKMIF